MKKNLILASLLSCAMGMGVTSCCGKSCGVNDENKQEVTMKTKAEYTKKYTNKEYYTDGKFNGAVALEAYKEMLAFYGEPFTDFMKENLWITDFNQGDFENVGMAGVFWVNDAVSNYFGHEIYLLPGQMIVEHKHVQSDFAPKNESWLMRQGMCYNFSIGEPTANAPQLPESQKGHITVGRFIEQKQGEITTLVKLESPHFLMAGPAGAIVTEFGSYHDGAGLRFTNPTVEFVDALAELK